MEPLATLPSSLDWETFSPSQKGYLPPANMYIDNYGDVYDEFREYLETPSYFRMKASPIAAMASYPDPPQPGLVNSFGQSIPLHDGKPRSAKFEEYSAEDVGLQTMNSRWETFISENTTGPLAEMNASLASRRTILSSLSIHPGPMDLLLPVPKTRDTHYATAFVFLPTKSTSLEVEAAFGTTVRNLSATEDTAFSAQIVVVYAGVDLVRIKTTDSISYLTYHVLAETKLSVPSLSNISPAIPGLRDAFRTWKWMLLNEDDPAADDAPDLILYLLNADFEDISDPGSEKAVVAHLAPLAKVYGFKLLVIEAVHEMSSTHEIDHPYKDYDYLYDRWDELKEELEVEDGKSLRTGVTLSVKDLNLKEVHVPEELKRKLEERIKEQDYVSQDEESIVDRDLDVDLEGYDDSVYSSTVTLSHTRRASFLLLIPE
ncbi:hypothetical protein VKT23_012355 [Stygiomarasmius scandens]|uniref:Uncharacterized protein n=1 Tax=Marasmiellus scandens TaxID=2682957 RepID=A0ABR1JB95_9AGAR